MKKGMITLTLLLLLCGHGMAVQDSARIVHRKNAICINPIGVFFGSIVLNYEHLFADRHGVFIQGGYFFGLAKGYSAAAQYRYHYYSKPHHMGLNSPFWGPFASYENSSTKIQDQNGAKHDLTIEFLKIGVSWGRKWVFNSGFCTTFRIGYGIPVIADFQWGNTKPDQVEAIESLTRILGGIDGEFSIGFTF